MTYFVKVFNRYSDGTVSRVEFDTESKMISDVKLDAQVESLTTRMNDPFVKNWTSPPIFQKIWALPLKEYKPDYDSLSDDEPECAL